MEPDGLDDGDDDQKENSIEDKEIKVSGVILRSASPVFDQMMQSEMMETQLRRITVHAHSAKDVDDLIFFICTDVLRENANAVNVMQLAHFYQMKRLLVACTKG